MSLLNDALRKRRSDEQSSGNAPAPSSEKRGPANKQKRKLQWAVIACVLVMSAATFGGWLYWTESDAAPDLGAGRQLADHSAAQPIEIKAEPMAGKRVEGGNTVSSESKVAVAPVKPDIPAVKQPAPESKTKPSPASVVPPAKVEPKVPTKVQAARPPEKKIAKIIPKKKSSPKTIRPRHSKPKSPAARAPLGGAHGKSLYNKARQYHRQGRLKQAIALYLEVIKVAPEHHAARFNLSAAYLQIEAYTQAYPIIEDLHREQPDNHQVMLNLAIAHIGCGRYRQALDLLNRAGGQPTAPQFEIAFHKGVVYSHLHQTDKALDWYKRAEVLRPDDSRLLFNIAVISDQQQSYAAAVDYYSRHLELNPGIDARKKKQIRRRIRTLRTYNAE